MLGLARCRVTFRRQTLHLGLKRINYRLHSLHVESIVGGDSLQPSTAPVLVFLHGLLGNGRNLRTLARKSCELNSCQGILIDLPGHGGSKDDPANKLGHAATAVAETLQRLLGDNKQDFALVGHSLGGRVCVSYLLDRSLPQPSRVWLLDTVPGRPDENVARVMAIAHSLVKGLPSSRPTSRQSLIQSLQNSHGLAKPMAEWLASSYRIKTEDFIFDLDTAQSLLESLAQQDLVGDLQKVISDQQNRDQIVSTKIEVVRGGANPAWTAPNAAGDAHITPWSSFEYLAESSASILSLHTLPKAGHWVHMEDLDGLLNVMRF